MFQSRSFRISILFIVVMTDQNRSIVNCFHHCTTSRPHHQYKNRRGVVGPRYYVRQYTSVSSSCKTLQFGNNDNYSKTTMALTKSTQQQQQQRRQRSTVLRPMILFVILALLSYTSINSSPAWARTISSANQYHDKHSLSSDTLGVYNLIKAGILVLITAGFGLSTISNVPSLSYDIIKACLRSTIQLLFFGGTILTNLLIIGQTRSYIVWGWITFTAMIAANEAYHRVEYTYPQLPYHLLLSFILGSGSIIGITVIVRILGHVQPWYTPRVWIPVAGMMLGNALSGTALAAKTITKEFAINADQIELRLSQGATWKEAIQIPLRTIYTTSLTPLMNFLSAAGIVHIPGLMTGQILAGLSPIQAATYQMIIFMLMTSTTCTTVQVLTRLAISSLVDQRNDRLQSGALQRVVKYIGYKRNIVLAVLSTFPQFGIGSQKRLRKLLFRKTSKYRSGDDINGLKLKSESQQKQPYYPQMLVYSVSFNRTKTDDITTAPILSLNQMRVARTNMDITFDIRYDDRIALTGKSGIGKSQVLRTLAGLEMVDRDTIYLSTVPATQMSMSDWRSHVVLVPQQRPSLEGTPNDFYNQILQYTSQRKKSQGSNITYVYPAEYGINWGVESSLFDRQWSKLSGGESQRIVLAIALSMQPDVLLLDESTSALDEQTSILVETTLKELHIPIVLVSHSGTQIDRFCNQQINLESTKYKTSRRQATILAM
jgi:uncharacterized protein (TIGR00245 family)